VKWGRQLVGCCIAIASLVGCGAKSREAAQAATEKFRTRVIRGAYAEIYRQTTPEFRASATEEQFEKAMKAIDKKLGRFQSAPPPGWRVNVGTGGKTVFLVYKSQFEKGGATEEFVWKPADAEPKLTGYHINSPLLFAD
jgi:hypothetical protein